MKYGFVNCDLITCMMLLMKMCETACVQIQCEKAESFLRKSEYWIARSTGFHIQKSENECRAILSPEFYEEGVYNCAGCATPLYRSSTKFYSGYGWPAFFEGLHGAINRSSDPDGRRTEITCVSCGGHLGHIFKREGFKTPTDERHCVNSVSRAYHRNALVILEKLYTEVSPCSLNYKNESQDSRTMFKDRFYTFFHCLLYLVAFGSGCMSRYCEIWYDSKKFWNLFHMQPMRDQKGEVQHFIGVQLNDSQHVDPLHNCITKNTVKEGEQLKRLPVLKKDETLCYYVQECKKWEVLCHQILSQVPLKQYDLILFAS
ncbi:hypothetical protein Ahy_B06g082622 [Arachis hypogaea]|uniref:MsrB domain-containing protein n=1 Tax=Arachis hypogaea TaxID=3818 RepID=A0A444YNP6_ARAHY|nr:hypothetical protein Ahy_B06g082622 [Arachis hypogaea]